jgi:hypothetical protein
MQTTVAETRKNHAHHWRIEEVEGPVSQGSCLNCGATREFRNYPAEEVLFSQPYGRRRATAAA